MRKLMFCFGILFYLSINGYGSDKLLCSGGFLYYNIAPVSHSIVFENKHVKLSCEVDAKLDYLAMVSYNESTNYFSLKTLHQVELIQVYTSEGDLDFQLPISNNLIHLSLDAFKSGIYNLNILFSGESDFLNMELLVK